MIQPVETSESRLLVVADLQRLGPIVADCFAPQRIDGVHTYLEAIAEIPRSATRAVLVGHDSTCRRPEAAVLAIKRVAATAPVVFCCEPGYEQLGRRLLGSGADDYIIFPPEAIDLEQSLRIPSRKRQQRWTQAPVVAPTPSVEELARLADILSRLAEGTAFALDALAALICTAVRARSATIVLDGRTARAVAVAEKTGPSTEMDFDGVLIEPIGPPEARTGQIRVGASQGPGFTHEDSLKLRHYAVMIDRLYQAGKRMEEWKQCSYTDDLTGLANRRHLMDFLRKALEEAKETRATITALVFDIDDFKRYNDVYGHDAGDQILRDVGRLFVTCCRKGDMVARYGGDEFVVVFFNPEGPRVAGSHHPEAVVQVVNRFRDALQKHEFNRLGPDAIGRLTISGGLAHFPWQARTAEELIEAADKALLSAKKAGKNRFWLVGQGGT